MSEGKNVFDIPVIPKKPNKVEEPAKEEQTSEVANPLEETINPEVQQANTEEVNEILNSYSSTETPSDNNDLSEMTTDVDSFINEENKETPADNTNDMITADIDSVVATTNQEIASPQDNITADAIPTVDEVAPTPDVTPVTPDIESSVTDVVNEEIQKMAEAPAEVNPTSVVEEVPAVETPAEAPVVEEAPPVEEAPAIESAPIEPEIAPSAPAPLEGTSESVAETTPVSIEAVPEAQVLGSSSETAVIAPAETTPVEQPVEEPASPLENNIPDEELNEPTLLDIAVTPLEPTPEPASAPVEPIPEILDSNYGVISEEPAAPAVIPTPAASSEGDLPTADLDPEVKLALGEKIHVGVGKPVVFGILIVIGIIGFLVYRLFFSVNPGLAIANMLRKAGNQYNEILSSNEIYKMLDSKDEVIYEGTLSLKSEKEDLSLNLTGGISKESNVSSLDETIKDNGNVIAKKSIMTVNNSYFMKTNSDTYYRFIEDKPIDIDSYLSMYDFKPALDNIADVIEQEFRKDKFESGLMRIKIDGKVKIVNNYSLVIDADRANELLDEMLGSIKNKHTKDIFKSYLPEKFNKEVQVNVYASFKGFEQLVVTYDGIRVKITPKKSSYVIIYDYYKVNIDKSDNGIKIKIDDTEKDEVANYDITWESKTEDNSATYNLNVDYDKNGTPMVLSFKNELKAVSSANLKFPTKFINCNSKELKDKYENEYNEYQKYLDKFNLLEK